MKVFVDSARNILAIHDESQGIADNAYDALGIGETRVIYLAEADVPPRKQIDGVSMRHQMPPGWEASYVATVPERITSTQGKLALAAAGKYDAAIAAIDALAGSAKLVAQIKWDAASWFRSDALFDQLGGVIGLNPAAVDDMFRAGRAY